MVAVGFVINGPDQIIGGVFLGSNFNRSSANEWTMALRSIAMAMHRPERRCH
jgi:hypothetical protein